MTIFGSEVACRTHLLTLVEQAGRSVTGLTINQLSQNVDRMNFEVAGKVCSGEVINELKNRNEAATKAYLIFMRHIITGYITESSTVEERIYSAWYTVFFIRVWKQILLKAMESQDTT